MNRGEIDKALKQCDDLIYNNASIITIECGVDGNIKQVLHSTSPLLLVTNALKEELFYNDYLDKSDTSKEESSMRYYNMMKEYKDKVRCQETMIQEMLMWIVNHSDCPAENEDAYLQCATKCSNKAWQNMECWRKYFEDKAYEKN